MSIPCTHMHKCTFSRANSFTSYMHSLPLSLSKPTLHTCTITPTPSLRAHKYTVSLHTSIRVKQALTHQQFLTCSPQSLFPCSLYTHTSSCISARAHARAHILMHTHTEHFTAYITQHSGHSNKITLHTQHIYCSLYYCLYK